MLVADLRHFAWSDSGIRGMNVQLSKSLQQCKAKSKSSSAHVAHACRMRMAQCSGRWERARSSTGNTPVEGNALVRTLFLMESVISSTGLKRLFGTHGKSRGNQGFVVVRGGNSLLCEFVIDRSMYQSWTPRVGRQTRRTAADSVLNHRACLPLLQPHQYISTISLISKLNLRVIFSLSESRRGKRVKTQSHRGILWVYIIRFTVLFFCKVPVEAQWHLQGQESHVLRLLASF